MALLTFPVVPINAPRSAQSAGLPEPGTPSPLVAKIEYSIISRYPANDRFEYGNMYEATKSFIGSNINRSGFYTQLAYRNYQSIHKHLQRLEAVFRYSQARFSGIQQGQLNLSSFSPPMTAPVNDNQYTIGMNYYFYPSTVLKFAYEINQELVRSLKANVFMAQFAANF